MRWDGDENFPWDHQLPEQIFHTGYLLGIVIYSIYKRQGIEDLAKNIDDWVSKMNIYEATEYTNKRSEVKIISNQGDSVIRFITARKFFSGVKEQITVFHNSENANMIVLESQFSSHYNRLFKAIQNFPKEFILIKTEENIKYYLLKGTSVIIALGLSFNKKMEYLVIVIGGNAADLAFGLIEVS
ncbi:MAG: hypothetical protein JSS76_16765 [Bacteroidetes bacterium]|nr:hypothetical protein [Bacteroidota bacterium]